MTSNIGDIGLRRGFLNEKTKTNSEEKKASPVVDTAKKSLNLGAAAQSKPEEKKLTEILAEVLGKDFDLSKFDKLGLDETEEQQQQRYNNYSDFTPEERRELDSRRYAEQVKK